MTTETAAMDMGIIDASMDLAVRALRTIPSLSSSPVACYEGRFNFFADGIQEPKFSTRDDERHENHVKYLSECARAKVIPFSSISVGYAEDRKLFVPKASSYDPLIPGNEESITALLAGGKIHKISLETSKHDNGFDVLKQSFLQTLIDAGYNINDFNLCLTTRYREPNSTLKFSIQDGRERGLVLHLGLNESEPTESLEAWFKGLRNYEASQ